MHETQSPIQDNANKQPTVLANEGKWTLVAGQEWDEQPKRDKLLSRILVDMFPQAVQAIEAFMPLPDGARAHVTLGSEQEALDWNVDTESALGFHAVWARHQDDDTDETYLDVNEHNEAVLNVSAMTRAIAQDGGDEHSLCAALVTLAHEMVHVSAFLKESKGRTPLELFDQEGGEMALRDLLRQVEDSAHHRGAEHGSHGHAEDEAEEFGRQFVDRWALTASVDLKEAARAIAKSEKQNRPR